MGTKRRQLLAGGLAWSALAWLDTARAQTTRDNAAFARLLQQGGCAVLIRHARTVPGIGDPAGFQIGACQTQRLLSNEGREDARRIGQWFEARQLVPSEVLSSQWCRCKDTATLAFGRHSEWPALNSTFADSSVQPAQTRELRTRLTRIADGRFEVWVTHQVNMTDLTGEYPATGEAFAVDREGKMRARWSMG